MADKSSDLVPGTPDTFILKTLALEPMYGSSSKHNKWASITVPP